MALCIDQIAYLLRWLDFHVYPLNVDVAVMCCLVKTHVEFNVDHLIEFVVNPKEYVLIFSISTVQSLIYDQPFLYDPTLPYIILSITKTNVLSIEDTTYVDPSCHYWIV